jgi:hypothetical protein
MNCLLLVLCLTSAQPSNLTKVIYDVSFTRLDPKSSCYANENLATNEHDIQRFVNHGKTRNGKMLLHVVASYGWCDMSQTTKHKVAQ